jgi:phosphoribosylformylglycinamidine (FGAM) synthase-like enzyme
MDDVNNMMTLDFKNVGDLIYLIGESQNDIASSQYLASFHKVTKSPAPYFDLDKEYEMHQVIKKLILNKLVQSVHDVADGGLYITLLESAMPNGLGFEIETDSDFRKDAFLFGEAQGRVIVSVSTENQEAFVEFMATVDTDFSLLGTVNNGDIIIDEETFVSVKEAKHTFDNVLHDILGE